MPSVEEPVLLEYPSSKPPYIVSTIFGSKTNPIRVKDRVKETSVAYMQKWADSLSRWPQRAGDPVKAVVIHDEQCMQIREHFREYPIEFLLATPGSYNTCDCRWFVYELLLRALLPRTRSPRDLSGLIFFTDISDVVMKMNPFREIPKYDRDLYVFSFDGGSYTDSYMRPRIARLPADQRRHFLDQPNRSSLCAGGLGGCISTLAKLVVLIVQLIREIGSQRWSIDMLPFNYALREYFEGLYMAGPPVSSKTFKYEDWREDVWFIHK